MTRTEQPLCPLDLTPSRPTAHCGEYRCPRCGQTFRSFDPAAENPPKQQAFELDSGESSGFDVIVNADSPPATTPVGCRVAPKAYF
jgi:hypothetical protein